jgi:multidrug resistance efflux pump
LETENERAKIEYGANIKTAKEELDEATTNVRELGEQVKELKVQLSQSQEEHVAASAHCKFITICVSSTITHTFFRQHSQASC